MVQFKKATKRIVAVATSAAMISSAVFSAGLSTYPNNFVTGGQFDGQVVVGASAAAIDTTSATSIIDDLKSEFSGASEKVKITYKSSSSGGETVNAVSSNEQLNYGEDLGTVTETSGFDDGDTDRLADVKFKNGISDEEYEQTLTLNNGAFNYALRDSVDGIDEIANGIYYAGNTAFATYVMDFKTVINLSDASSSSDLTSKMVGKVLTIMGNDFTIGSITKETDGSLNKVELLGGSNKVSLGEGESTTVTVEGNSYEISVQSVASDKVLITVNGASESIDEFDTEEVGGVTIAVTDLVSSSRDSVKGYAEIVVGGQKLTLEDNKRIKVNDEDVDDIFPSYDIYSDFSDAGSLDTITITYKVDDDTLLQAGDYLDDVLFQSFRLEYDGTNNPDYSEIEISVNDDDLNIKGTTVNGEEFDQAFLHLTGKTTTSNTVYVTSAQDDKRVFYSGSKAQNTWNTTAGSNGVMLRNSSGGTFGTAASVVFNLTQTGIKDYGFLLDSSNEEQYLYIISSVDTDNDGASDEHLVDFDELLREDAESDIKDTEWDSKLGKAITTVESNDDQVAIALSQLGDTIAFENEMLLVLDGDEETGVAVDMSSSNYVQLKFQLDSSDVDGDNSAEENDGFNLTIGRDSTDDEFDIKGVYGYATADIVNSGLADNVDGSSDDQTFVTTYGLMAEYENQDNTKVVIKVPEEQVYAKVNLVFGGAAAQEMTVTVDADMADDKKAELEDDGYTVVSTETVSSDAVEFDVAAPVLDSDVTGTSDMIVVGGPAVNSVAAELLGLAFPTMGSDSGVNAGEAVIRYFEASNSVVVYGYEGADTKAAAAKLNAGGLSGSLVNVQ
jgi:hypothetical protein